MRVVWTALIMAVLLVSCSPTPPAPSEARNPDWVVDSTDWTQRLHCPDGDGYVVLRSTNDFALLSHYWAVVYVLERRGHLYIGRKGLDVAADPPTKAWSIDTACCGCDGLTQQDRDDLTGAERALDSMRVIGGRR